MRIFKLYSTSAFFLCTLLAAAPVSAEDVGPSASAVPQDVSAPVINPYPTGENDMYLGMQKPSVVEGSVTQPSQEVLMEPPVEEVIREKEMMDKSGPAMGQAPISLVKNKDQEAASGPEEIIWSDTPSSSEAAPHQMASRHPAAPVAFEAPAGVWHAELGAPMEYVLNNWSQDVGVDVMWNSMTQFRVLSEMNYEGRYEEAVQALLEQYDSYPQRPVGRLHVDKTDGHNVLVIETSG